MKRFDLKEGAEVEKFFIITIDTEGDYLWKRATTRDGIRKIEIENAKYIERFQLLCNKYNFIPTYLVNYEMAYAEPFVSQAREWLQDGKCEIGMHMHAWNTPPIYNLPFNRKGHNPFAGEYPREILWKKMCVMTDILQTNFNISPTSHRGGRWYIDSWYIQALKKLDYMVDCSITPGINWDKTIGNTMYGSDYRKYPKDVFILEKRRVVTDIGKLNVNSGILEIPPTIIDSSLEKRVNRIIHQPMQIKEILNEKIWLRPNGTNLKDMLYIVEHTQDKNYIEFMIHSSELMPGGSPCFKTKQSIENVYRDLDILFSEISKKRRGISLTGYGKYVLTKNK